MKKTLKQKMSGVILGSFLILTIGAMTNPVTWVEKMFLPQNNFTNPGFEANDSGLCLGDSVGAAPTTNQSCSGSPSLTKSFETTNPLEGGRSIKISKGAANRQGEFIAIDFTISRAQRNKPNTLEFKYEATSNFVYGTASDIQVFIADTTTSQVIAPAPMNYLDGSGHFKAQWQAGEYRNYQLLLWIPTTTTLSWDLTVDSFKNALSEWVVINSDSDWVSYTPTFSNMGTVTPIEIRYRKIGPDMLIEGNFTTGGTLGGSDATMTLPTGYSVSTSYASILRIGTITRGQTTTSVREGTVLAQSGDTAVGFSRLDDTSNSINPLVKQIGTTAFGTSTKYTISVRVQIQGWTSGAATPGVAMQKVPVTFSAYKNGGAVTANTTIPTWTAVTDDSVGAFNASTGQYIVKYPGIYAGYFQSVVTVADLSSIVKVNGNQIAISTNASTRNLTYFQTPTKLNVGDIITLNISTNKTIASNNDTIFSLYLVNDPSAFLTIPKVATIKEVQATNTNGGTATSGSWFTRVLNTLEDPYGIVSLSSNQFTLQPGRYRISWSSPANQVAGFITRLYNVTTSTALDYGSGEFAQTAAANVNKSVGVDIVDISVATTFRIEMTVQTTKATNGLGNSVNLLSNSEVYTQVEIQKLL